MLNVTFIEKECNTIKKKITLSLGKMPTLPYKIAACRLVIREHIIDVVIVDELL